MTFALPSLGSDGEGAVSEIAAHLIGLGRQLCHHTRRRGRWLAA